MPLALREGEKELLAQPLAVAECEDECEALGLGVRVRAGLRVAASSGEGERAGDWVVEGQAVALRGAVGERVREATPVAVGAREGVEGCEGAGGGVGEGEDGSEGVGRSVAPAVALEEAVALGLHVGCAARPGAVQEEGHAAQSRGAARAGVGQ